MEDFSKVIQYHFDKTFIASFQTWEDAFQYIGTKAEQRTAVIIDEFPYIIEENPSVKSILQHMIDHSWKNKNIFLTIDLDVLDPSLMSGVGTPEAGGLSYKELMDWLVYLKDFNIVGADIMELAPDIDITKTSSATCCKLIREVLMLL